MSVEILQTFYHRMMPLFTPQAEKILDSVRPEKFQDLAFRYTFSVEAIQDQPHHRGRGHPHPAQAEASYQILSILHQIYPTAVHLPLTPDLELYR